MENKYKFIEPKAYADKATKYLLDPTLKRNGYDMGWESITKLLTAKKGEHCILYGAPNMGKTTWLYHNIVAMAIKDGLKIILWSPEEFTSEYVIERLIEIYLAQKNIARSEHNIFRAMHFIDTHFRIYETPRLGVNWNLWKNTLEESNEVNVWKPDMVCFDNMLMFDKTESAIQDDVRYMINSIIDFCEKHNLFAWLVNHIAAPKLYYDANSMTEFMPPQMPSKLAGGQMWERFSWNIMEVFRPKGSAFNDITEGEVWINVHKVKNKNVGTPGHVKLWYDRDRDIYKEIRL